MTESQELMLFAEGSLVRISVSPEIKRELRESEAAYGVKCAELLATLDQNTQLWKTSQTCLLATTDDGLAEFSETWPKSGMMRNGIAYQLHLSEHPTGENESGLLPTPRANKIGGYSSENYSPTLMQALLPTPKALEVKETPEQWAKRSAIAKNKSFGPSLSVKVQIMETLGEVDNQTAREYYLNLPTPTTSDAKGASAKRYKGSPYSHGNLREEIRSGETDGQYPHPKFVEWMMGFPTGHTDLKH